METRRLRLILSRRPFFCTYAPCVRSRCVPIVPVNSRRGNLRVFDRAALIGIYTSYARGSSEKEECSNSKARLSRAPVDDIRWPAAKLEKDVAWQRTSSEDTYKWS